MSELPVSPAHSLRAVPLLVTAILLLLLVAPAGGQHEEATVVIEWPNEGETVYAGPPSLLYNIPVRGYIAGLPEGVGPVDVKLEVWRDGDLMGEYTERAVGNRFTFHATVNPQGSVGQFPAEYADCASTCHRPGGFSLPAGPLTLRLSIVTPAELNHEQAERQLTVDRSGRATVPVNVRLADDVTQPVAGVTVSGATRLYLYRGRQFLATSDTGGRAVLSVETLSQAPTDYVVRVDPTIVDGVLYKGDGEEVVHLSPEMASADPVTLYVRAYHGRIIGHVANYGSADRLGPRLTARAIALPDGRTYETPVSQTGNFSFEALPIDQYRVALDGDVLMEHGQESVWQDVNLTADYEEEVALPLSNVGGTMIEGQIVDNQGRPLPFAWVTFAEETAAARPNDGHFQLRVATEDRTRLLVQAPGFYSRVQLREGHEEAAPLTLVPQPDTRQIPWQDGSLWIPAESTAEVEGHSIYLKRGWLWGKGHGALVQVETDNVTLVTQEARFAVEYLPGRQGWLYVLDGTVDVNHRETGQKMTIIGGQMINLFNSEGLKAVAYDSNVLATLNVGNEPLLPATWQPTLAAQIRDRLALLGIGMVQVITFITYFLVALSLGVLPIIGLYFVRRRYRHYTD